MNPLYQSGPSQASLPQRTLFFGIGGRVPKQRPAQPPDLIGSPISAPAPAQPRTPPLPQCAALRAVTSQH